jgi:hypothetical protein
MDVPHSDDQLSRGGRFCLLLLIPLFLAFGVVVEMRGALLKNRWTDLTVFLRAAWAVKQGEDLYQVTDTKGLHYHYPPLLAIVLMPLADPPAGTQASGTVPFPISVALWYLFSVAVMVLGIHTLASALEEHSPLLKERSRRGNSIWWALRTWPFLACLPTVGHALSLGQVNVLWLALVCMMGAALVRGRSLQAGMWLAGAICLKVLPLFLLIYPVWRRDTRCLAGCVLGLLLGLVVVPSAVLGPKQTLSYGQEWTEVVLMPAIGYGSDRSRADELIEVTSTQNQALSAVFHNTIFADWNERPALIAPEVRLTAWFLGILLTAITLFAAGWRSENMGRPNLLLLAALNVNMLLLAPVGHPHYLVLLIPLMMGIMVQQWERKPFVFGGKVSWLLIASFTAVALPLVPNWIVLFNLGMPMYAALALWLAGVVALWQQRQTDSPTTLKLAEPTPTTPFEYKQAG